MNVVASILLFVYPLSSAPNWVPGNLADAFDRQQQDSIKYEAILRAEYQIVACEVMADSIRITIKRATIIGEFYQEMKAEKCEFSGNRYTIKLKPIEAPFPWKEVLISATIFVALGFAAGSSVGR